MDKNLLRIEFDKVLDMLSSEASSEKAKEKIKSILPSQDVEEVKALLNETLSAFTLSMRFGMPSFGGILHVDTVLKKACSGATLFNEEFLNILSTLKSMRKLKQWKKFSEDETTYLDNKFEKISVNKYLEKKIESTVLSESEISDDASEELANIRKKMRVLNQRIRDRLEHMVNSHYRKYLMDPIVTMRSGRFVIPVKSEYRNEIKGLVHDISSSGSTLFIEPIGVVENNNFISELKIKEKSEIDKILFNLSREVEQFSESIAEGYDEAVNLDVIFAKASLAIKTGASFPEVNSEGVVDLKKARHPLISKDIVQPIDIRLGQDFDTLIITGPNTGGKTVSLKTLGLMCVMAMSGMMLPAAEGSKISVFDGIFVDIGDEQSIEHSISTFSSHMENIIKILGKISDKSLVLIDEIGAGTDPEEGAALAIALVDYMRMKHAKIVLTTHYKELKEYAVSTEGIQCACCDFDVDNMRPTYKLLIGSIGSSNAFLISEKLGLSPKVIKRAENILGEEKVRLNEFLSSMEKTRRDLERKQENIDILYAEAKKVKEEACQERKKIDREYDKIMDEARFKAQNIVDRVKIDSQNIIKTLNEVSKEDFTPEKRGYIRNKISEIENIADPVIGRGCGKHNEHNFKEGDRVQILGFEKEGIISSKEDNSGNFLVSVGKIKTKIPKSKLKLSGKKECRPKISVGGRVIRNSKKNTGMEIDLRGKTVLEAIPELEFFLDNAFISGISQVTVIHGKGSGVLRREVHKALAKNRCVKDFRLGNFGEGEDGVTIVSIK